jgi:hypothetical protein
MSLSELDVISLFGMSLRRPPHSFAGLLLHSVSHLLSSVLNPRSAGCCCAPPFLALSDVQAMADLADDRNLKAASFDHG